MQHASVGKMDDLLDTLQGTEVFLDSLSTLFSRDHGFMLCALQCLRLSRAVRDQLGSIFSGGGKVKVKQVEREVWIECSTTLSRGFCMQ